MPLSGKVSQAGSAPLARSGDAGEWTLRLSILFESERVLSNGFPPISANLPRYAAPETAPTVAKYRNCSRSEAEGAACQGNENDLRLSGELVDGDTEPERCQYPIYEPPPGFPTGWWVCTAIERNLKMLRSSLVIGVSKRTGAVQILGEAGDEG